MTKAVWKYSFIEEPDSETGVKMTRMIQMAPDDVVMRISSDRTAANNVPAIWILHQELESLEACPRQLFELTETGHIVSEGAVPLISFFWRERYFHAFAHPLPFVIHEGRSGTDPDVQIIGSVPNPLGVTASIREV